ncbi:lactonase family protein [Bifidobacterium scaligerum]|uniref:Carboxy-cis,cis-muconate cyclase n=1 Tax=Bifidobacterium scaligerum TaxID=2052656 RepID=A0A2M9HPS7_9BIFI|nr:beta-propeller fold lactonase family protein [Bifidobacterium scaligerum]PJM78818.1 carboxy-cis,cis-muconate cyclase [Bifidobacterium scaligerum]
MTELHANLTVLVGGFGAARGSSCPGIEAVSLRPANSDSATGSDATVSFGSATSSLALVKDGVLADVPSPTWIERDGDLLYAVLEDTNEVAAFRIEHPASPVLTELSRVAEPGASPTHAVVVTDDLGAKHLIVANYADGHVCVHPIAAGGAVLDATQVLTGEGHGPLPAQEGPHAHWILPLPDGRVLSTDLGADRIYVHRWSNGVLERVGAVALEPGTGPRDMHLLPVAGDAMVQWRVAVVGEWSDTVTMLGPDTASTDTGDHSEADGIAVLQTVDLGGDPLDQAASLALVPWSSLRNDKTETEPSISGIAYVGLRGSERIVALQWDGERLSRLAPIQAPGWQGRGIDCGGSRPRHILPVGDLLLVANEVSNNLTVFRLSADGSPIHASDLPSGSPTVFVRL